MSKPQLSSSAPLSFDSDEALSKQIFKLLQNIHFGSLEIIVHDGKVVQIEKHEKFRLNSLNKED